MLVQADGAWVDKRHIRRYLFEWVAPSSSWRSRPLTRSDSSNIETNPARETPDGTMTKAQLDKMSAELNREFVADTFDKPTAEAKERLRRANRKHGYKSIGGEENSDDE
ncbi:MAG: hypothetical protein ACE5EQ_06725 [Phycisphaerae bacterium]